MLFNHQRINPNWSQISNGLLYLYEILLSLICWNFFIGAFLHFSKPQSPVIFLSSHKIHQIQSQNSPNLVTLSRSKPEGKTPKTKRIRIRSQKRIRILSPLRYVQSVTRYRQFWSLLPLINSKYYQITA